MRRLVVVTGCALALALVLATAGSSAAGAPVLRSVSASHGHLIVTFKLGPDLVPGRVVAGTNRATLSRLAPGPSVKLREAMQTSPALATGVARWRTHKTLPAGTYYVEISGIQADGITDCMPHRPDCLMRWSNSLRIVVP
jgi:hypothetical protein